MFLDRLYESTVTEISTRNTSAPREGKGGGDREGGGERERGGARQTDKCPPVMQKVYLQSTIQTAAGANSISPN